MVGTSVSVYIQLFLANNKNTPTVHIEWTHKNSFSYLRVFGLSVTKKLMSSSLYFGCLMQ